MHAYRGWSKHIKKSKPNAQNIILMNDLSEVPHLKEDEYLEIDWINIFENAASSSDLFSADEILKVKQSLSFSQMMDIKPNKESIESCGGMLVVLNESLINDLSRKIAEIERNCLVNNFKNLNCTIDYASNVAMNGFSYFRDKLDFLHPIDFKIEPLESNSPFGAQVITNHLNEIVCQLKINGHVTAKFVDTIIHEILGHVLHFSQLKENRDLQNNTPHLLCLSLHTHEPFFVEAIAQLMTIKLLESDWDFAGKGSILLENLKFRRATALVSMILTLVFEKSIDTKEAAKLHCKFVNDESEFERFVKIYNQSYNDLILAKIRLNFYSSFLVIEPLLKLNDDEFYEALKILLFNYFTPSSIKSFVSHYGK